MFLQTRWDSPLRVEVFQFDLGLFFWQKRCNYCWKWRVLFKKKRHFARKDDIWQKRWHLPKKKTTFVRKDYISLDASCHPSEEPIWANVVFPLQFAYSLHEWQRECIVGLPFYQVLKCPALDEPKLPFLEFCLLRDITQKFPGDLPASLWALRGPQQRGLQVLSFQRRLELRLLQGDEVRRQFSGKFDARCRVRKMSERINFFKQELLKFYLAF